MIRTPKREYTLKASSSTKSIVKIVHKRPNSFDNYKKPQISKAVKQDAFDIDSIGEEGTPQMVRSPIGNRDHISVGQESLIRTVRDISDFIKKDDEQEIKSLKAENEILKTQLNITKKALKETRRKYEITLKNFEKIEKVNIEVMKKNTSLFEELERINKAKQKQKCLLQDELERKIIHLHNEKEDYFNMYQCTLIKLNQYLCEFAASEEWVLGLRISPYLKREIDESADEIRKNLERIRDEIFTCQSQMKVERFIDKSYVTSISSSFLKSPIHSPK